MSENSVNLETFYLLHEDGFCVVAYRQMLKQHWKIMETSDFHRNLSNPYRVTLDVEHTPSAAYSSTTLTKMYPGEDSGQIWQLWHVNLRKYQVFTGFCVWLILISSQSFVSCLVFMQIWTQFSWLTKCEDIACLHRTKECTARVTLEAGREVWAQWFIFLPHRNITVHVSDSWDFTFN